MKVVIVIELELCDQQFQLDKKKSFLPGPCVVDRGGMPKGIYTHGRILLWLCRDMVKGKKDERPLF